jgi:hypothetical protein
LIAWNQLGESEPAVGYVEFEPRFILCFSGCDDQFDRSSPKWFVLNATQNRGSETGEILSLESVVIKLSLSWHLLANEAFLGIIRNTFSQYNAKEAPEGKQN